MKRAQRINRRSSSAQSGTMSALMMGKDKDWGSKVKLTRSAKWDLHSQELPLPAPYATHYTVLAQIARTLIQHIMYEIDAPVVSLEGSAPLLFFNASAGVPALSSDLVPEVKGFIKDEHCSQLAIPNDYVAGEQVDPRSYYTMHLIPKKGNSGVRMVHAPSAALRSVQEAILQQFYQNTGDGATHESNIAYVPGKGFVEAVRRMRLKQEHMVSEDLKNYYHQVNGSKLTGALLSALKNEAYTPKEFSMALLHIAHKTIHLLAKIPTHTEGEKPVSYNGIQDKVVLQVAADALAKSMGKKCTYVTAGGEACIAGTCTASVHGKPDRVRSRVSRDAYLASMEIRAVDTLLTTIDALPDGLVIDILPDKLESLSHINRALRCEQAEWFGQNEPTAGPAARAVYAIYTRTVKHTAKPWHWYGTDVLSLAREQAESLPVVVSPIIELYQLVLKQFVSAPILVNYDRYEELVLSAANPTSIPLVVKEMVMEEGHVDEACVVVKKFAKDNTGVALRQIPGVLYENGISAKRLRLKSYMEVIKCLTDDEKDTMQTRFSYGLPQGALTSSFLANMVANTLLERIEAGYKEMDEAGVKLHYKNLRTIVYSDNVYSLFDVREEDGEVDVTTRRIPLPYENTLRNATTQVRQIILDSVLELELTLNEDKSTVQSGNDKKMLGLLLDSNGNIRVPRRRVYETNQILIALHKSGGSPIDYKGHTYSAKDKRRLTGLLEWNKTVGRSGYSQTMYLPDKRSRNSGIVKKAV